MSSYNLKVIDYGEFVQYRIYSRSVVKDFEREKDDYDPYDGECVPFDGTPLKDCKVTYVEDEPLYEEKRERSKEVSVNRTVQTIYKYAQANKWDYFVTLTFARDGKVDVYNYDKCVKKLVSWLHNQRRKAPDLKYLFVPEMHKDGAFHFHGLIANCEGLQFEDSGRVAVGDKAYKRTSEYADYPVIYNMSGWKYGFSTATKVTTTYKASSYICKYITKELVDRTFKRRRFYPSNNLDKPIETEYNWTYEDIEEFKRSLGDRINYIKTQNCPDALQSVTYIQVMKAEE